MKEVPNIGAFGRRLDGPGGRRTAPRDPLLLPAAMHGVGTNQPVSLLDVSRTGARMSFTMPLYVGQEVWLKVPPTDIFGILIWVDGDECGVQFDRPFSDAEVAKLRAQGKVEIRTRLTPNERRAISKWRNSMAADGALLP